jgi:GTP-binding protein HflX
LKALVSTSNRRTERVFLVGVELKSRSSWDLRDSLDELTQLAVTAGATIIGDGVQKLEAPVAATFIGTGKAQEFSKLCRQQKVDTVIFDDELSPAQGRNLEKIFECKVLDRTSLILDIFARRARTREGKLQIELAQLQHLRGERSLAETIELVKTRTRQFAKRQLTWFRRQLHGEWVILPEIEGLNEVIENLAKTIRL